MRQIQFWRLLIAFDFGDSDAPGERTALALVGVKASGECGLRLIVWGAALFFLWAIPGKVVTNEQR